MFALKYSLIRMAVGLAVKVELFNTRDTVFQTVIAQTGKAPEETLKVQTREGLVVGLAVSVRYRLDARRLHHIHANLPQPVDKELVPPVVASVFREIPSNYMVRRAAAEAIRKRLAADAVDVKEVTLRDIHLPAEYAKGLEGLLLEEQKNERMAVEMVRAAELESHALKARQVKPTEADAQVMSRADADRMRLEAGVLKDNPLLQNREER